MKKLFYVLLLIGFFSCSQDSIIEDIAENVELPTTKSAGDGKYDVLGYGYDITEPYVGENSVKFKIVDVEELLEKEKSNPKVYYQPSSSTAIYERVFVGSDATTYIENIITKTNFNGSVASEGLFDDLKKNDASTKKSLEGLFSASVKYGREQENKYSYSSKYAFANADVVKKQKSFLIDTELEIIRKYLTPQFLDKLENLTAAKADQIVRNYGTHLMMDIEIGGFYRNYFRTIIIEESSSTRKKEIVEAGAKFGLSKIGLNLGMDLSKETFKQTILKNSLSDSQIRCWGGSTHGSSYSFTTANLVDANFTVNSNPGKWAETVTDVNSVLINLNWNRTYPIYELVTDPSKKAMLKAAVERYIDSKKIEVLEVALLYRLHKKSNSNTWFTTSYTEAKEYTKKGYYFDGGEQKSIQGYVFKKQYPGTVPLYRLHKKSNSNTWFTTSYTEAKEYTKKGYYFDGGEQKSIQGYILKNKDLGTVPLYRLHKKSNSNTWLTTSYTEAKEYTKLGYYFDNGEQKSVQGYVLCN
ncbi:MAC/perforin domain-containing protein [Dysgonomonas massiliensis]|uniref:MAC/perforin domain-containing protein n=1 Tax=Dysgonomonas massiliensis TaxID=2040292 RepID=UPI000C759CFD|nr:MAC/perforin domain-containing protein [Dysgonomonas massiliensis]